MPPRDYSHTITTSAQLGPVEVCEFFTPVGALIAASSSHGLLLLTWRSALAGAHAASWQRLRSVGMTEVDATALSMQPVATFFQQYFSHQQPAAAVAVDLTLSTPFRRQVQPLLAAIPYGQTISYGDLARRAGAAAAVRAAASACAHNPVALVLPCHRVLRADGSLGGFIAGVAVKQQLLEWERSAPGW